MFRKSLTNTVCILGKYAKNNLPMALGPITYMDDHPQSIRYIKKHWDPKFKKFRKEKLIKLDKPRFNNKKTGDNDDTSKMRRHLKMLGILPVNEKPERPMFLYSSLTIQDPYEPPEGDGKYSEILTKAPQKVIGNIKMKGKNLYALRKIKSADATYTTEDFLITAQDVYIKAHEALANDPDNLIEYVTEHAYPRMTGNAECKVIKWKFLESLEPPRIVQMRYLPLTEENTFGQITVRFFTQQMLAVYDRFGRLMQGSEILRKDVLEYVIFEKSLNQETIPWRLHAKIFSPHAKIEYSTVEKTYVKPKDETNESEIDMQLSAEEKRVLNVISKY